MRFILILLILFFSKNISVELLKPNSNLLPKEVISIQLVALQKNNIPYENAGVEQVWEFAHPINRQFTGPLKRFTIMMYTPAYFMLINHIEHNIIFIKQNETQSFFFVELINNNGIKVGFQWIVEKVIDNGEYNNCWMTSSVSQPIFISKSV